LNLNASQQLKRKHCARSIHNCVKFKGNFKANGKRKVEQVWKRASYRLECNSSGKRKAKR